LDLLATIAATPQVGQIAQSLAAGRHVVGTGAIGSTTSLLAAALAGVAKRPVMLVVAHLDDADEAEDELSAAGVQVIHLPGLEVLPGESGVSVELFAERLAAVRAVAGLTSESPVIIAPIQALMQAVPAPARMGELSLVLSRGETHELSALIRWLDRAGYKRVDAAEEPGDFALRGGILDVFPAGGQTRRAESQGAAGSMTGPVRLDFFGDQIDRITEVDPETMGSGAALDRVELVAANVETIRDEGSVNFLEVLPEGTLGIVAETLEITEQGRGYYERVSDPRGIYGPPAVLKFLKDRCAGLAEINQFSAGAAAADARVELPASPLPGFAQDAAEAVKELATLTADHRVSVYCQNPGELQRFQELITEFAPEAVKDVEAVLAYIHRGFVWTGDGDSRPLAVVPYHELLHRYHTRRRAVRMRAGRAMDTFLDFAAGDFVVHTDHGIAKFIGLKVMKPPKHREIAGGVDPSLVPAGLRDALDQTKVEPQEYLTLEFAGGAKLHVPATNIDQIQKYIGGFRGKPQLSTLGGQRWKSQKEKVAESVRDLAAEMLRVRAAREHMPGIRYPADTSWQKEFEAEFPYEETEDQLAALAEIKKDMQSDRPMDRLICGDVGFGKTELAIRAAFKAVEFRQAGGGAGSHDGAGRAARADVQRPASRITRSGSSRSRDSRPTVSEPRAGGAAEGRGRPGHRHAPAALERREVQRPGPGHRG
jgi:transcription-repair coupling factor (superfamily II helicase)